MQKNKKYPVILNPDTTDQFNIYLLTYLMKLQIQILVIFALVAICMTLRTVAAEEEQHEFVYTPSTDFQIGCNGKCWSYCTTGGHWCYTKKCWGDNCGGEITCTSVSQCPKFQFEGFGPDNCAGRCSWLWEEMINR